MIARVLLAVALLIASVGAQAAQVTVGSKNFTEAVLLGEIATAAGQRDGVDVQHRARARARASCGARWRPGRSMRTPNTPARWRRNCCSCPRPARPNCAPHWTRVGWR